MRAAVYRPGMVRVHDVERPVPKGQDVLVRIHASTICAADYRTVIDRYYPLDQIEEAQRYAATGHKKGHVVIRIAE